MRFLKYRITTPTIALFPVDGRHVARTVPDGALVSIDESLLKDDKDMLEDLIAAAMNDAVRRVESTVQERMAGVTAGMPLPPGFKMPF